MEERKTRTGRDEWRKRIERWQESGLSAEAFAAELGTKPATLKFWKYRIEQETRGGAGSRGKPSRKTALKPSSLVEVRSSVSSTSSFVLELSASRRLQIPAVFDEQALERLLTVLERR
jgi:transposase